MNQLVSQQPAGGVLFAGTVNEPAAVTIGGKPARENSDNSFSSTAFLATGTNTVAVTATDASGNAVTNGYQVDSSGSTKAFTYDANGNLTSDGTRTFEWDSRNALLAVTVGTHRSEFTYDGQDHRVRIVEKDNGSTTSDQQFLWCGDELCEGRSSSGSSVTRRFFDQGVVEVSVPPLPDVKLFYTHDHLGSIREVTDGATQLRARYEYDAYGRRTKVSGDQDAVLGFEGHYEHGPSGTSLTRYRPYDAELGRWLSDDPLRSLAGNNLTTFVENDPVNRIDPDGLYSCTLVSSRVLATIPIPPYNKERTLEDTLMETAFDPSHQKSYFPANVLRCLWARKIVQTQRYVRMIIDKWSCTECDKTWTRWQYREEQFTNEFTRTQLIPTAVFVWLVTDAFSSPRALCNRLGRPPAKW